MKKKKKIKLNSAKNENLSLKFEWEGPWIVKFNLKVIWIDDFIQMKDINTKIFIILKMSHDIFVSLISEALVNWSIFSRLGHQYLFSSDSINSCQIHLMPSNPMTSISAFDYCSAPIFQVYSLCAWCSSPQLYLVLDDYYLKISLAIIHLLVFHQFSSCVHNSFYD